MKKSDKTELTIARIVESAIREFGENGYASGTMNNICKAGINKGLIYHNFASKDELYLTCVQHSCKSLTEYIEHHDGTTDLQKYMATRMEYFQAFPNETHIFFEALLNPPAQLSNRISEALKDFNLINERVYQTTLNHLVLRDGISMEHALSYFHLMQTMLNGYFSSPAFQNIVWNEKVKIHESMIPKLLDYMIYGIAKGEK